MIEFLSEIELHGLGLELLLLIFFAGLWAGTINTVVGSGTLVTFPVLVAMGIPPVSATVSNAIGLIAGNFTGAWGYRREIREVRSVLAKLIPASVVGGVIGALLLITLPPEVFGVAAPFLILIALAFVIGQPWLSRWVKRRQAPAPDEGEGAEQQGTPAEETAGREDEGPAARADAEAGADIDPPSPQEGASHGGGAGLRVGLPLFTLVFLAGIYGGYFVAAQGILLMGILGVLLAANIQQANGVKNLLVAIVNLTAAISYVIVDFLIRDPDDRVILWGVVAIIAVGSTLGGLIGAWIGRRLSPIVLRSVIVLLGCVALGVMVRNLIIG